MKRLSQIVFFLAFLSNSDLLIQQSEILDNANRIQKSTLAPEITEISKIMFMSIIVSTIHGVVHDSASVNICFDYLSSNENHHGIVMQKYFSNISKSQSKIGHILVWGVLSTFVAGTISGAIWAYAARSNPDSLTWRDLLPYTVFLSFITLTGSGIASYNHYKETHDLYSATEIFHNYGYAIGIVGAIALGVFFRYKSKELFSRLWIKPNGFYMDMSPMHQK